MRLLSTRTNAVRLDLGVDGRLLAFAGERLASFFWVQSLVRDVSKRALLFDMDTAITQLNQEVPRSPALVMLTGAYHNLLRQWAQT